MLSVRTTSAFRHSQSATRRAGAPPGGLHWPRGDAAERSGDHESIRNSQSLTADLRSLTSEKRSRLRGFTLLELLVVIAAISILFVLVTPAFTNIKRSNDVTNAAYTITGVLEQARTYAMANNTYTWVGFYEENTTATVPTNTAPPYPGKGRLLMAAVYSTDGTKIFDNGDPVTSLPASRIRQVGKLIQIEGVHLTDIGAPPSPTPSPIPDPNTLDGRPDLPYTYAAGIGADHYNRVSSDSADTTRFNFTAQSYTFTKTVRFNPRGEANLNSTYSLKNVAEIGLRPTHGNSVDNASRNLVAIQFGGIGGNFKIYRR